MKFNLYNIPVVFDDEFQIYNRCRIIFFNKIDDLMEGFYSYYHQKANSVENLIDAVSEYYSRISSSLTVLAVKLLVQYGILNCNEKIFQEKYFVTFSDITTMNALLEQVDDVDRAYSQRQQEKAIERASRSQWVGGGYGIGGAIKGAIQAEAMNMITDGFRSIGDSYSDNKDKQKVLKVLSSLIRDDSVCQGIYNDIKTTGFNIFMCFLKELYDNDVLSFVTFPEEESNAKFENVIRYKKNSDEILRSVIECIRDNPYEVTYYEYLVNEFGDPNKEIEKMAKYLGFEEKIQECKDDIMQDVLDMPERNCTEVYKKIEEVQEMSVFIARDSHVEVLRLKQLDIKYRTVDSILFETEQEANTLKKCLSIPENSYDKVCEKIKTVKETEKKLSIDLKKHIDRLEEKEKNFRNIKGIQCETYEDAQKLQLCFNMEEQDYNGVVKKLNKFLKLQEEAIYLCESMQLKSHISELKKKEKNFRTVENIEYKTIYEADRARNILLELDKTEKEKFDTLTIEELLAEKEKAQKYNYRSQNCKNYAEKVDERIALLKDRLSEGERYYNEIKSIDLYSKEAIETFEKSLEIKHEEVKEDISKTLLMFKVLIKFKEDIDSFRIPSEVNKVLSDIETVKSSIKLEKYKDILQPEMLKEVNEKLNYLQSDGYKQQYKQQYEKAIQYQIFKSNFSFKSSEPSSFLSSNKSACLSFLFYLFLIVMVWKTKERIFECFLQGEFLAACFGVCMDILFLIFPLIFMIDVVKYILEYFQTKNYARTYVSEHPECETIWNEFTKNGTKPLEEYH